METRPLYKKMASLVQARLNCIDSGNLDWERKHEERINDLVVNFMPSGSGIDTGCIIDFDRSHGERLVFNSSYHTMDEYGYYGRWIDFTVTIRPSLESDFDLTITGKFGKDQDIKDYLYDTFAMALERDMG